MKKKESANGPRELFFGLVGPTGCDKDAVIDSLKKELENYGYKPKVIKLSELIKTLSNLLPSTKPPLKNECEYSNEYKRLDDLMNRGNALRAALERGDTLALLTVAKVIAERKDNTSTAYIFDSLKRPEEVETLRSIYRDVFSVISIYTPRDQRVNGLSERITKKEKSSDKNAFRHEAEELIYRDTKEREKYGQNVSDTFPLGNLFVDTRISQNLARNLKRYVETILGHPYHTPTKDEHCMALAAQVSLRSADLSRQVGAAIATEDGEIIALGCNDVPKFGGGLYWPGHVDARDFHLGYDSGTTIKNDALHEILSRFQDVFLEKHKEKHQEATNIEELFGTLLGQESENDLAGRMKGTLIRNLLEFGRSVHAEMAALMEAARRGVSVKDATLYCTTFPCHLCARHIVASGIKRVVYIEPYPKSLAGELYKDSLVIDPPYPVNNLVVFEPFVGVAPRQYVSLFTSTERKHEDSGKSLAWPPSEKSGNSEKSLNSSPSERRPKPRFAEDCGSHRLRECWQVGKKLGDALKKKKRKTKWLYDAIDTAQNILKKLPKTWGC